MGSSHSGGNPSQGKRKREPNQKSRAQLKAIDEFWRQKTKAGSNLELQGHMAVIAMKSKVLKDKFVEKLLERSDKN